jgi:hypothetical protein
LSKRKPWYVTNPELYAEVRREVEDFYPYLKFFERGADVFVGGWYPLFEGDRVYDQYLIEVELPKDSPKGLPTVREVGDRIPREPDRHMERDGRACVALPDAFWYEHPKGMGLLVFLNGPVRWFFVNQSLIERGKKPLWEDSEWEHAGDGIVRFYQQHIGTDDPHSIMQLLEFLTRDHLKGHWPCPCGSEAKLRNCHWSILKELWDRIPKEVAKRSKQILSSKTVLSK